MSRSIDKTKATLKSDAIPQANTLGRVIHVVGLVADGYQTATDVAAALGCVERQGRYYLAAAESLHLIKTTDELALTGRGKRLLAAASDPYRQQRVLREAILRNPALAAVHEQLSSPKGKTPESLVKWLAAASELNRETAARRLESVVNWLLYAGLVYAKDGRLKAIPA